MTHTEEIHAGGGIRDRARWRVTGICRDRARPCSASSAPAMPIGARTPTSAKAVGECGIITSLINKFNADNPDVHVNVTTVEWPGYDQLTAQFAAGDPPDIVTIHQSVLADYQSKRT
jgi:hypothetical protein